MKKFIYNLASFTVLTIPIYLILLISFGELMPSIVNKNLKYKRGGNGFMDKRIEELDKIKNVDVLFIGSSHAYRSYDTRIFEDSGIKTFNLGSSAQTPLTTKFLLEGYFDTLNPSLVLIDIYPFLLTTNGIESALNIISNSKSSKRILDFCFELNDITVYNTLIFTYYKNLIDDHHPELPFHKLDKYIKNGFIESKKVYKEDLKSKIKDIELKLNINQLDKLDEIIEMLRIKGTKFYLIQSPITEKKYNSFSNNQDMDSVLNSKGRYINFNELLKLDDSLFMDDNHLNQNGVKVFNKKIFEYIDFKGL